MKHNSTNFYAALALVAETEQGPELIARVQWYTPPRGNTVEAVVRAWAPRKEPYFGVGRVRGCGFDLVGAALREACHNAGLPEPREGFGVDDRLWPKSLAEFLGVQGRTLVITCQA